MIASPVREHSKGQSRWWKEERWESGSSCQGTRDEMFDFPRPKNFSVPFSLVLDRARQLSLFVEIDEEILGGTPRIDNTRIPVYMVLNAIDDYGSIESATRAYRCLTSEQVRDALRFAVHVLESPLEHEPSFASR